MDPDEVATLWGVSSKPPAWVEGGRFTPAFFAAYGVTEPDREKLEWYALLDEFF